MEQRQHAGDAVMLVRMRIQPPSPGAHWRCRVWWSQHCALGRAGGAAGIVDQRDVVDRVDRRGGVDTVIRDQLGKGHDSWIMRPFGDFAALEQPVQHWARCRRQRTGDRADHWRRSRAAFVEHLQRGRQRCAGRQGEQQLRAQIGDMMLELGRCVERRGNSPPSRRAWGCRNRPRHNAGRWAGTGRSGRPDRSPSAFSPAAAGSPRRASRHSCSGGRENRSAAPCRPVSLPSSKKSTIDCGG